MCTVKRGNYVDQQRLTSGTRQGGVNLALVVINGLLVSGQGLLHLEVNLLEDTARCLHQGLGLSS